MELVVISSPRKKDGEVADVIRMFDAGLERFHLRKPGVSKKYIKEFLEQIPLRYRSRIVIHSNHHYLWKYKLGGIHISKKHRRKLFKLRMKILWYRLRKPNIIITRSCHKLGDLLKESIRYDYVFLSPVFDSISVNSLSGGFSHRGLTSTLGKSHLRVYAMGGIEPDKFQQLADYGFAGAALLGFIWSAEDRMGAFELSQKKWLQIR